jgi:hypothetical protein
LLAARSNRGKKALASLAFSYVVRISIDDERVLDAFVSWLHAEHVADVCAAGARDAELVIIDVASGEPRVVEARYHFESREAFETYERDEAPRLRAEGLAKLAALGVEPGRGVAFQRTTGTAIDL